MSNKWISFLLILTAVSYQTYSEAAESCKSPQKKVRVFARPIGCNQPYTPKYRCVKRLTTFQRSYVLDEIPEISPESSYPGRRDTFSDQLSR